MALHIVNTVLEQFQKEMQSADEMLLASLAMILKYCGLNHFSSLKKKYLTPFQGNAYLIMRNENKRIKITLQSLFLHGTCYKKRIRFHQHHQEFFGLTLHRNLQKRAFPLKSSKQKTFRKLKNPRGTLFPLKSVV